MNNATQIPTVLTMINSITQAGIDAGEVIRASVTENTLTDQQRQQLIQLLEKMDDIKQQINKINQTVKTPTREHSAVTEHALLHADTLTSYIKCWLEVEPEQ